MGRLRAVWPDVQIHVRGDSGLGVPLRYDVCRALRLSYTFGIGMNAKLRALSDTLLADAEAVAAYERTGQLQRLFLAASIIRPRVGLNRSRSSSRWRRMPRGPTVGPWSPTGRVVRCCRRPCTTRTRCGGRARTATRSSSVSWRPTGSATIGSWRTSFGCTCTPPRCTCWFGYGTEWCEPRRRRPSWGCPPSCPPRRSTSRAASGSSTRGGNATRWGKGSRALGGRG